MNAHTPLSVVVVAALVLSASGAPAAPKVDAKPKAVEPAELPPAPEAVERLIGAEFLSDGERKDKRVFFGRYSRADLDTPGRAARAALVRGSYNDPAFDAVDADPLDAAESLLARGELVTVLTRLDAIKPVGDKPLPIRAAYLRVQVLSLQGKADDAVAVADAAVRPLLGKQNVDPEDATYAVRLVALRIKLRGPSMQGGAAPDYHALMSILADIRTRLDRFYWPAVLAEAELLYAKDNREQAAQALEQVLNLNPTCAQAWALLGRLTVDGFTFDKTETIARRLALLAGDFDPESPDGDDGPDETGVSIHAAMLMARAMLRQSEGSLALDALAPALKAYPLNPELQAIRCAAEAVKFDLPAADACLVEFDTRFGPSNLACFATGAALSESRQYAPAAKYLRTANQRTPTDPDPLITLGLLQIQAGKDDEARDALEKAFALDPFNVRADNSLRLVRELLTYERFETDHFVVRYKKSADGAAASDAILAREMPAIMEQIHSVVAGKGTGGIDHEPQQAGQPKTLIDLMPDHEWFGVRIAGMPAIHTIAASTGPIIAMESPREGPKQSGPYDWVRVVRHEYVHTVTLSRTKNRIPHWFTEASAVNLELAPRDYSTIELLTRALKTGKLFDFQQINIAFVRPKKSSDRAQAYAQGHWMYEYILQKYGNRAPLDLMDKYAQGVREEEAFQQIIGKSRAEFMREFTLWAWGQLHEWGMALPDEVPTIKQLLAREALTEADVKPETAALLNRIADGENRLRPPSITAPSQASSDEEGDDENELDSVKLPQPTSERVAKWLVEYPKHPDVLELAVDEAIAAAKRAAGTSSMIITSELQSLLERYAEARPVDPKPHRLLAKMYLDRSAQSASSVSTDASKAIPHLEFLDQREQRTPLYAMELARRYAAIGDLTKARARAERATQIAPFDPQPRELAATIDIQARNFDEAQRHLLALSQIEPDRDIHKRRLEALGKLREHK
jgi:tetratricopeptide (TPR) repeat protein